MEGTGKEFGSNCEMNENEFMGKLKKEWIGTFGRTEKELGRDCTSNGKKSIKETEQGMGRNIWKKLGKIWLGNKMQTIK